MIQIQSSQHIIYKDTDQQGDDACDFKIVDDTLFLTVLCDGVGSARKGGAAARQIVKFFMDQFKTRPKVWGIEKTLATFTQHINKLLFKESMTQYESIELLSTLCVAVIEADNLYTLNLGDSRIYLEKQNGEVTQLSTDHNMDDEHLSHVLVNACGLNEHVNPEILITKVENGDRVVLCSDGVYNLLPTPELFAKIDKGIGAKLILSTLEKEYKERDDMALQIFNIESLDELHAVRNLDLIIPESPKRGDVIDGYVLEESMMQHNRIWKVKREGVLFVMKFPMSDEEQAVDEFVREAWYAKQITHKAFGDAWVPEDRTYRYYMMELIEGTSLQEYLSKRTISVDSAIDLGKFLHKAEAHLLHLGLVHGDIKPENIIVYKNKETAGVSFKMVDFGSIVEVFSENSRAGTPTYLAPERFVGENINEASEVFSIGITLYWALTGKFPYGEIEPFQTPKFKIPRNPKSYNPNIPSWLDSIILRAIAIDTDQRYQHYSEFFYELKDPINVKPFFDKSLSIIERSPLGFYKYGFFFMMFLNFLIVMFLSQ